MQRTESLQLPQSLLPPALPPNLLTPKKVTRLDKKQIEQRVKSKVSAMPKGLLDVLTKQEIGELMSFLQSPGFQMPEHLKKMHSHHQHGATNK